MDNPPHPSRAPSHLGDPTRTPPLQPQGDPGIQETQTTPPHTIAAPVGTQTPHPHQPLRDPSVWESQGQHPHPPQGDPGTQGKTPPPNNDLGGELTSTPSPPLGDPGIHGPPPPLLRTQRGPRHLGPTHNLPTPFPKGPTYPDPPLPPRRDPGVQVTHRGGEVFVGLLETGGTHVKDMLGMCGHVRDMLETRQGHRTRGGHGTG